MTVSVSRLLFEKVNNEWKYEPKCHQHEHCIHNAPFIDVPSLHEWMCLITRSGKSHFESIIGELIPDWPQFHDVGALLGGENKCVLVLSILQKRQRGHLILKFWDAGITDKSLIDRTYDLDQVKDILEQNRIDDIQTIVEQFEKDSWEFCIPMIDPDSLSHVQSFDSKIRFPFCQLKRLSEGGQATVFEVKVPEKFVVARIRAVLGEPVDMRPYGKCYDLAIKSYPAESKDMFDAEVNAFRGIARRPGFILHFGHYSHQHGEPGTSYDHHIILEKGSCDLIEYFYTRHPPERSAEIWSFWQSICEVAESVMEIQQLHHQNQAYLGWHGDIKPGNILLVKGEWNLADFGFTTFKRVDEKLESAEADLEGVTRSYGPPEWRSTRDAPKSHLQAIDNWALGCVLSVTATWVVLGYKGVEDFEYLRQKDKEDDAFHKDGEVLHSIPKWFRYLREVSRRSDEVTPKLLDLVEEGMLKKKPMDRMPLQEICEKFRALLAETASKDQILARSRSERSENEDNSDQEILDTLVRVDGARRFIQQRDHGSEDNHLEDRLEFLLTNGAGSTDRSASLSRSVPKPVTTSRRILFSKSHSSQDEPPRTRLQTANIPEHSLTTSQGQEAETNSTNRHSNESQIPTRHELEEQTARKESVKRGDIFELAEQRSVEVIKKCKWILSSFPEVVRDTNEDGCTPIMVAASHSNTQMVKLLLDNSDLTQRDNEEKIVLHHAVLGISSEVEVAPDTNVIRLILDQVSRSDLDMQKFVNAIDCGQRTSLWFCVNDASRDIQLTKRAVEAAELLLANKACIQPQSSDVRNVLHHAILKDDIKMVELFLSKGEKFRSSSYKGINPSKRIRRVLKESRQLSWSNGRLWSTFT